MYGVGIFYKSFILMFLKIKKLYTKALWYAMIIL